MGTKNITRTWTVFGRIKSINTSGTPFENPISQQFVTDTTIGGGSEPRYKEVIQTGGNATTTLVVQAHNISVREGSASVVYFQDPQHKAELHLEGLFPFPAPQYSVPVDDGGEAEASAVKALYAKINEISHQLQGGVVLGELHQTVSLVMSPLNGIARATTRYLAKQKPIVRALSANKKLLNKASRKSLKSSLAQNYLTWVYGVSPLISDIEDLSKTIARAKSDPKRVKFTAHGSSDSTSTTDLGNVYTNICSMTRKRTQRNRTHVKYYGQFRLTEASPGFLGQVAKVGALAGFDLRSFVPTIWNLIPYSFVADYFVNVGDMLEAACTDTSSVLWISRTAVSESIDEFDQNVDAGDTIAQLPGWTFDTVSGSPGGFTATSSTIFRGPTTVPILVPRLKIGNNPGKHALNLLALVTSRL